MTNILKIIILIFTAIFLLFLYSTRIEPSKLVLKEEKLHIPNWHKELNGLKITVVSDLHIGFPQTKVKNIEKIVNIINKTNPDLILILGDLDALSISNTNSQEGAIKVLSELKAPLGVIAIMGNHDYKPAGIVPYILKNANIKLLENEKTTLFYKKQRFDIYGIKDIWNYKVEPSEVLEKIQYPTLFLSHNPDIFPKVPKEISLTLSGHTHGGEISLPLLGAPLIPSIYAHKYAKGHIIENNKHLYVTSGIATTSGFRTFNSPEIIVLNLYDNETKTTYKNKIRYGLSDLFYFYNKYHYGKIIK